MKKRFLISGILSLVTIVVFGQTNVRIGTFDLKDANEKSLILGYNMANATGAWDTGTATAADLDFIYKAGTDLSNVTLVTTPPTSLIINPPTNFSAPLQLKTQNGTTSPYSYCLYNVNPRQLTPVELPATMDIATPFSSATKGWAAARLDQRKPTINGKGTDALGFPAAGVFVLLAFSNAPDYLYFKPASAAATNGNVLDIYESVDGITWSASIANYSDAAGTISVVASVPETPKAVKLSSTTRFVKFLLSARSAGNFYIFDISATAGEIVEPQEPQNVRIKSFDLKDASNNSLILGYNAANAAFVLNDATPPAAADLDFIYKAGTDLSNVTLVADINSSGFIADIPTDFSLPLQLKTQNNTTPLYSYCLYSVNPRQLTPVELPAIMDISTPFSSDTKGWAQARLDQRRPTINGVGTDALGFLAADVFTLLAFTNAPGTLSFKIAGSNASGNTFSIYESTNGIMWNASPTKTYSGSEIPLVGSVPSESLSVELNSTTRFVKFILSARNGNFYLYNISVAAARPGLQNCRIMSFDLQDASNKSLILGYNAANATGAWDTGTATPAELDFIYKAGTDLSDVTLVASIGNFGFILNPPSNFSVPLQLKTQNYTDSPYSYSIYNVNPRQLTPVELPAIMDISTPFSSATKGWAAARLDQRKPTINGKGTDAIGFPAAGVLVLLAFSNNPDYLYFKAASAAATNGNVLDVYESVDGITWSASIANYSDTKGTIPVVTSVPDEPLSVKLSSTTRFVKFVLSARSAGNFYIFDISATPLLTGISNTFATSTQLFAQNGLLNIVSNETVGDLEIFASSGQSVAKIGNPSNQVNIADLPAGCYIVKLKSADGQPAVCRFVK